MPSFEVHNDKYEHNKSFLNNISTLDGTADWQVTVIFYCAVHYIEALLAKCYDAIEKNGRLKLNFTGHSRTHEDRCKMLEMTNEFDYGSACTVAYEKLEADSRKARYDYFKPNNNTVEKALKRLKKIEELHELTIKWK